MFPKKVARKGVERRMFASESVQKICKVNLINGIIARVRCIFKIYHSFIIPKILLKPEADILSLLNGFTINSNLQRWSHEIVLTSTFKITIFEQKLIIIYHPRGKNYMIN